MDPERQALRVLAAMRGYEGYHEKRQLQAYYLALWKITSHPAEYFTQAFCTRRWPDRSASITWRSNDGGKDVVIKCNAPDESLPLFVEVKWWRKNRVGPSELERNWEWINEKGEEPERFIVMNLNEFTSGAYTYANEHGIELWNGIRVCEETVVDAIDLVRERVDREPFPYPHLSQVGDRTMRAWRRYSRSRQIQTVR